MPVAGVIANVVGVIGELHRLEKLKCGSIIDLGRPVKTASNEQALTFHIDAEVIEASLDIRQGDAGFQRQSRGLLSNNGEAIQQE